ncbi:MAG: aldehyde dehydrogenase family protein [Kibdelosporangium sp.]
MTAVAAATVRQYGHHIGGEQVDGTLIDRHDPARGQLVARFAEGSSRDVDRAVKAARQVFTSRQWSRLTATDRAGLLEAFAALVTEHRDRLAGIDSVEVGKPLRFAQGDIDLGIAHIRQAAALARTARGEAFTDVAPGYTAIATRRPVGVAGLIIPWNFPGLITLQKLPYALAAGCPVVIKPSEFTSGSALELAALAETAGFPPGAVNVVTGYGPVTGAALVQHPDVGYVSFTGSTATGRAVLRDSATTITRVGLELGGKAANVVFADADLDAVADGVVFGAFANQGESCVAGSRLIVQEAIAAELSAEVVRRAARLRVGMPDDPASDLGALIHHRHRDSVAAAVTAGTDLGAEVLLGGQAPAETDLADGAFFLPTVLGSVAAESPVFQEEIFGPVLSITTFQDEDDAVRLANATRYGLAQSLWTKDVDRALSVGNRLDAGTVWVNTTSDGAPELAFGGVKGSGFGRDAGAEGLREFTEYRTLQLRGERRPSPFASGERQ